MNLHLQEIESLQNSLRERQEYVTELENRLRALWDKYDAERKHYVQLIGRLEKAGNEMYKFINPPSPCMRTTRMDDLLQGWDDAKINTKEAKP
jgi:predicted RNase H-like nuclease (RuvC/YqgF family)